MIRQYSGFFAPGTSVTICNDWAQALDIANTSAHNTEQRQWVRKVSWIGKPVWVTGPANVRIRKVDT